MRIKKMGVKIVDTSLRDGHQSLIATRLSTADILPIAEILDKAGYHALEVWGGATFDACLRFLNEDPWERLDLIRKACPNTKLQMLFRGQNILGYRHYSDEVVEKFVQKSLSVPLLFPFAKIAAENVTQGQGYKCSFCNFGKFNNGKIHVFY